MEFILIYGIKKILHTDGLTINGVKRLIKENGINFIISIGKDIRDNNLNIREGKNILKKINIHKSKIDKEKINELINKLNFLRSKIESRMLNDF